MTEYRPHGERRRRVRTPLVLLPNGFTLANLFCGIYAIVLASRGLFDTATLFVVIGGIADALDGRVARATGTGSRFGEELDSLVDAISFGFAPAMIMFFAVFNTDNWEWLFVFIFTSCAVMRLARFNVEQAGRAKTHFHGLPSPVAGMTLASYWWFRNTPLYKETVIRFTNDTTIADLPWNKIIPVLMLVLGFLMLSNVPYPAVPTVGIRTTRQRIGSIVLLGSLAGLLLVPRQFIFPALLVYIVGGVVQAVALGFIQRRERATDMYLDEEVIAEGMEIRSARPSVTNGARDVAPADTRPMRRPIPQPQRGPVHAAPDDAAAASGQRPGRRRRGRRSRGAGGQGPKPAPPDSPDNKSE